MPIAKRRLSDPIPEPCGGAANQLWCCRVGSGEEQSLMEHFGRYWWLVGIVALAAWFVMLWFMFGDVL